MSPITIKYKGDVLELTQGELLALRANLLCEELTMHERHHIAAVIQAVVDGQLRTPTIRISTPDASSS